MLAVVMIKIKDDKLKEERFIISINLAQINIFYNGRKIKKSKTALDWPQRRSCENPSRGHTHTHIYIYIYLRIFLSRDDDNPRRVN